MNPGWVWVHCLVFCHKSVITCVHLSLQYIFYLPTYLYLQWQKAYMHCWAKHFPILAKLFLGDSCKMVKPWESCASEWHTQRTKSISEHLFGASVCNKYSYWGPSRYGLVASSHWYKCPLCDKLKHQKGCSEVLNCS